MACPTADQVKCRRQGRSNVTRIKMATVAALLLSFVALPGRQSRNAGIEIGGIDMRIGGNGVTIGGIVAMIGGIVATMSARPGVNTWKSVGSQGSPARLLGRGTCCRRDDRRDRAQRLNRSDWIYRGSDNRYYCRRDDGTTGLIVGGITGGVLGNVIAPGGSKTLGAIIGAGAGR